MIRWLGLQEEKVHVTRSISSSHATIQATAMPRHTSRHSRSSGSAEEVRPVGNLIQLWLTQYDRGELNRRKSRPGPAEYEAKIAALERKVGQLTMELDLLKKTPRLHLVSSNENSSIVSGPKAAPSEGGAK